VSVYIYIYIYIYMCVCIYICTNIQNLNDQGNRKGREVGIHRDPCGTTRITL